MSVDSASWCAGREQHAALRPPDPATRDERVTDEPKSLSQCAPFGFLKVCCSHYRRGQGVTDASDGESVSLRASALISREVLATIVFGTRMRCDVDLS